MNTPEMAADNALDRAIGSPRLEAGSKNDRA